MAYKDMISLFGHRYDDWREKNADKSGAEIRQWLSDQKLNVEIEQKIAGEWTVIDEMEMVGDEIFAEYYVDIKESELPEFRLSTGFKFWDVDYVAMAKQVAVPTDVTVLDVADVELADRLGKRDQAYATLNEKGDHFDIQFVDLPVSRKRPRTLFLKSSGYYESNATFESKPRYAKLLPFRKAGELSRYSHELYKDFQSSVEITYSKDD